MVDKGRGPTIPTLRLAVLVLPLVAVAATFWFASASGVRASTSSVNWTLTWSDEFNAADGSSPDPLNWSPETGGHGWGNNELQNYTARPENARIEAANLVIEARQESFGGNAYTSARLKTKGLFEQTYGKFEARMKLPLGKGIWPAFWMLGANISEVGWPACGEIDIMEHVNHDLRIIGSLHGPGYNAGSALSGSYDIPDAGYFDTFHTYAVEWGPDVVYWYLDDDLYSVKSIHDVPAGGTWAFNDHPFFIILNVAVGGFWPGNPDATTVFPQKMLVDYVRAYVADGPLEVPTPEPTPTPGPFHGAPAAIPGTIQAEDFDYGGEGVAYHDGDPANNGGAYRPREAVDIGGPGDTDQTPSIGWAGAGEWLDYAVSVAEGGIHTLDVRVASSGVGGTFHVSMDGVDVTGPIGTPNTGGWGSWQTITTGAILSAGVHEMRVVLDANGPSGAVANFNWFRFTPGAPPPPPTPSPTPTLGPWGPSPAVIPGTVQIEEYDRGGEGVAYHDLDASNNGGAFRPGEGVDLQGCADVGGGFNLGWSRAGEWLKYSVSVTATGTYTVDFRVAVPGQGFPGGRFHLEVDGTDATGPVVVPDTGGWQNWTNVSLSGVPLPEGNHVLRVVLDAGGARAFGNFNFISFTREDTAPPVLELSATPNQLWPPNHQLEPIDVQVAVTDDQDPAPVVRLESIGCDGGCDPAQDVSEASLGTDDRNFELRSERSGHGARVYAITYSATDAAGNRAEATVTVDVPHDQR